MYAPEFVGLFLLSALVGLANVSGIGGGGITVPLVGLCWGFSTKKAIALSGATIFFGQIVRFIYQIKNKHPEKKATHIDYGITIVMFPLVLTGTTIGVLVNLSFPPIILNACLCIILLILGIQSIFAAKKRYDKETRDMKENHADS